METCLNQSWRYTKKFKREAVEVWQTHEEAAAEVEQDLGIAIGVEGDLQRGERQPKKARIIFKEKRMRFGNTLENDG